ncbi:MAG: recombinase-like helix-turn-helix domain-containing protein [Phyllobacterium sp.]
MFNDQLARQAATTGRPALANQCRGRELTPHEQALADALSLIFGEKGHDFDVVAAELTRRGVSKPHSGGSDWTEASLEHELKIINAELDAAYLENGYGA